VGARRGRGMVSMLPGGMDPGFLDRMTRAEELIRGSQGGEQRSKTSPPAPVRASSMNDGRLATTRATARPGRALARSARRIRRPNHGEFSILGCAGWAGCRFHACWVGFRLTAVLGRPASGANTDPASPTLRVGFVFSRRRADSPTGTARARQGGARGEGFLGPV